MIDAQLEENIFEFISNIQYSDFSQKIFEHKNIFWNIALLIDNSIQFVLSNNISKTRLISIILYSFPSIQDLDLLDLSLFSNDGDIFELIQEKYSEIKNISFNSDILEYINSLHPKIKSDFYNTRTEIQIENYKTACFYNLWNDIRDKIDEINCKILRIEKYRSNEINELFNLI